jgi:hypothetical protein
VAYPCADAEHFSPSQERNFWFAELSCKLQKKTLASIASIFFFSSQESSPNKKFLF